ncbi:hypothetical protein [Chitinophaga sp. 22620]|uniref:hypothetical protein n=1 Tax=Chitinophaga sp. 22620 TaxID=3453952 RepID=UPI003F87BA3D
MHGKFFVQIEKIVGKCNDHLKAKDDFVDAEEYSELSGTASHEMKRLQAHLEKVVISATPAEKLLRKIVSCQRHFEVNMNAMYFILYQETEDHDVLLSYQKHSLQNLLNNILDILDEALDYMYLHFSVYFDMACYMPLYRFLTHSRTLKREVDELLRKTASNKAIFRCVYWLKKAMVDFEHSGRKYLATYAEFETITDLARNINKSLENCPDRSELINLIHAHYWELNFNYPPYAYSLFNEIMQNSRDMQLEDRFNYLSLMIGKIRRQKKVESPVFDFDHHCLKTQLITLLQDEYKSIELKITTTRILSREIPASWESFRISTPLTVEKMAFYLHYLVEEGFIQVDRMDDLFSFACTFFTTLSPVPITASALANAFEQTANAEKVELKLTAASSNHQEET